MKKVLFLLLVISACSNMRQNGIYPAKDGWDIVEDGKVYQYRCETDGLYLYIDWDGANSYGIVFDHNDKEKTFARLYFLCKNKDDKYVYVANYPDINAYFYKIKGIGFEIGNGREVIHQYKPNKDCFSLLEKYTSR